MSPSDTDLVEVALETLVALEKLRNILAARHEAINVLAARLNWESARRIFYIAYAPLADDVDAFVTTKARWSPSVYSSNLPPGPHSPDPSAHLAKAETTSSPILQEAHHSAQSTKRAAKTNRSHLLLAEILSLESQRLLSRIDTLRNGLAARTGQDLDSIIILLKVPDPFLDEQDRIDGLVEDLGSKATFLRDLIKQWEHANRLYHDLLVLQKDARTLAQDADTAVTNRLLDQALPSCQQRLSDIEQRLAKLTSPQSARSIVTDCGQATSKSRFNASSALPCPSHTTWPDQAAHSTSAQTALNKELAAATKRIGQAARSVTRLEQACRQLALVKDLQGKLVQGTADAHEIAKGLYPLFDAQTDDVSAKPVKAMWADVTNTACATFREMSSNAANERLDAISDSIRTARDTFQRVVVSSDSVVRDLKNAGLACTSLGVPTEFFKQASDDALSSWNEQQSRTKDTFKAAERLRDVLVSLTQCLGLTHQSEALVADGLQAALGHIERSHWVSVSKGRPPPTTATLEASDEEAILSIDSTGELSNTQARFSERESAHFALAREALDSLRAFSQDSHAQGQNLHELSNALSERIQALEQRRREMQAAFAWASTLHQQSTSLIESHAEYWAKFQEGLKLKTILGDEIRRVQAAMANELSQLPCSDSDWQVLREAAHSSANSIAAFVSAQDSRTPLAGEVSNAVAAALSHHVSRATESVVSAAWHTSPDPAARAYSHDMCLELSRINEDVKSMLEDLQKRSVTANEATQSAPVAADTASPAHSHSADSIVELDDSSLSPEGTTSPPGAAVTEDGNQGTKATQPLTGQPLLFPSVAIDRAVQACESEIARRRKTFTKILHSSTSRRLPKAAFLAELRHRKLDAKDALLLRLKTLRMVIEEMESAAHASGPIDPEQKEQIVAVDRECKRIDGAIENVLAEMDTAIDAEGGSDHLVNVVLGVDAPRRKSIAVVSPLRTTFDEPSQRRRSAVPLPSSFSMPSTLDSDMSVGTVLARSPKLKVAGSECSEPDEHFLAALASLSERLSSGDVERQTVPSDGSRQARSFLDLPTLEEGKILKEAHVQIGSELSRLSRARPAHPELATLQQRYRERTSRLSRFHLLAEFADQASTGEKAVSGLLQLLDDSSQSGPARDSVSPSPSPTPSSSSAHSDSTRKLAGSRPSSGLNFRAGGVDGPLQGSLLSEANKQMIKEQVAALEALIERISKTAEPVSDDVRVRDRLAQLNTSFVEVSDLSQDSLDPANRRSQSALSHATTDSFLSRSSSPALSVPSVAEAPSAPVSPLLGSSRLPVRPRVTSNELGLGKSPTRASRRPRTSSLASVPPPSATAQRALARSMAAAAAAAAQAPVMPSTQSRRMPPRRSGSLGTSTPQTPRAKTPLKSQVPLPVIDQSPGTPSSKPSTAMSSSRSFSHLRTPSSVVRASGSLLPTLAQAGQGSLSHDTPRRPNRYHANPKSKLDMAVGKLVNRMPVPVQIVHASKAPGARVTDDWKDESGRYWVGHPDPKLCFCRILRSRTVMVRIGGGWQELTRYIMQHYHQAASAAIGDSPSASKSAANEPGPKSDTLPWISAATMRERTPHDTKGARFEGIAMTPSRSSGGRGRVGSVSTGKGHGGNISSPILISPHGSPETHFGFRDTPTRRRVDSTQSVRSLGATTPTRSNSTLEGRQWVDGRNTSAVDHEATPTRRISVVGQDAHALQQIPFQLKAPEGRANNGSAMTPSLSTSSFLFSPYKAQSSRTVVKGRASSGTHPGFKSVPDKTSHLSRREASVQGDAQEEEAAPSLGVGVGVGVGASSMILRRGARATSGRRSESGSGSGSGTATRATSMEPDVPPVAARRRASQGQGQGQGRRRDELR